MSFPDSELRDGTKWESSIHLPIPGFVEAAPARLRNRLVGYQYIGGRYCGVIEQEFVSEQKDGTLDSPESDLGEGMQFAMPLFLLEGMNRIYFDVENGQLVGSDMDLRLIMSISQMLGGMGGMAEGMAGGLQGLVDQLSGVPGEPGALEQQDSLLDLDLRITGKMVLLPQ